MTAPIPHDSAPHGSTKLLSIDARTGQGKVLRVGKFAVIVHPRVLAATLLIAGCAVFLALVAMTIGTMNISVGEVFSIVFLGEDRGTHSTIVRNIRLPRIVAGLCAGAALGASGAIFQSVSRNALGSPDVIGFTTGAATGAIVQIVLFQADALYVALGAVVGGLGTAFIVYVLARKGGVTGGYRLILTGIGVGAVLSAVNSLLMVMGDLDQAISANVWLSGSLDARKWDHAVPALIGVLVLLPCAVALAKRAAMLEMGDDIAAQLGINVERTRIGLVTVAVLLAGVAVGATGPIAFVALAAPQVARRVTRTQGLGILGAASMGAVLLVLADVTTQLLPTAATIPIGRMTGIIGGIYLIWLLVRSRQV